MLSNDFRMGMITLGVKVACAALLLTVSIFGHDYIPGQDQKQPVLLKGGTLYTISQGVLLNTDLLFENGRITAIGANLIPPEHCQVIDVAGKNVYPGLIEPNSSLGLTEIGAVPATLDISELGDKNPDVQTHIAYNPDSEILPTIRANGITTALVVPEGQLLRGRSSLLNLDGWTKEDAMEKENVGLHISWPRSNVITAWWMRKTPEEQRKENQEYLQKLYLYFDQAKNYYLAKTVDPSIPIDLRWDAMLAVFSKDIPVFVHADDYRQIDQALAFANKYDVKMILVGGDDSWKLTSRLKASGVPVIVGRTQSMPRREDDPYDLSYHLPQLLAQDSVKFCLSYSSHTGTRNLPFQASQAVAFGLDPALALRSITLSTAEILGVDKDLGSLEVGKKATLVVSFGDIMDHLTHNVVMEFIDGRPVDLNSRHKELYLKYRQKKIR